MVQAIRHDPNTLNDLETMDGKGQTLVRTGFAVMQ